MPTHSDTLPWHCLAKLTLPAGPVPLHACGWTEDAYSCCCHPCLYVRRKKAASNVDIDMTIFEDLNVDAQSAIFSKMTDASYKKGDIGEPPHSRPASPSLVVWLASSSTARLPVLTELFAPGMRAL
jgi:hypothetical protein